MTNPELIPVVDFVEALHDTGVTDVVVSPGSRSTPLTMAFSRHGGYRLWSVLDERSAAFFALGLARSRKKPVTLVCTSGTAAANYLPAVMEAHHTGVPLVLVTADRPPELRGVGANQTVDQVKVYGSYVKWYAEMPVPAQDPALRTHARAMAGRIAALAAAPPAGPVHLNWPFREPLIPPAREDFPENAASVPGTARVYAALSQPAPEAVEAVREALRRAQRPLLVVGPQEDARLAERLRAFAARAKIPLLADPLSQVRTVPGSGEAVIDTYDAFLRYPEGQGGTQPDLVLRFGRTPVSKALGQYLAHVGGEQVLVTPDMVWHDPYFTATRVVQADAAALLDALAEASDPASVSAARNDWYKAWTARNRAARAAMERAARDSWPEDEMDLEGRLFLELADLLPPETLLFVGNSMPVRDMDTFFPTLDRRVHVLANRGASGIDGVISSALGAAAGFPGPAWLVIGDVSFYHDLGALALARRLGIDLRVVLVHNDGGGIFEFLPQSAYRDTFEQFRTPHGLDFEPIVRNVGGVYQRPAGWTAFRDAVRQAAQADGLVVLEVRTDAARNRDRHREVMDAVREAVRG